MLLKKNPQFSSTRSTILKDMQPIKLHTAQFTLLEEKINRQTRKRDIEFLFQITDLKYSQEVDKAPEFINKALLLAAFYYRSFQKSVDQFLSFDFTFIGLLAEKLRKNNVLHLLGAENLAQFRDIMVRKYHINKGDVHLLMTLPEFYEFYLIEGRGFGLLELETIQERYEDGLAGMSWRKKLEAKNRKIQEELNIKEQMERERQRFRDQLLAEADARFMTSLKGKSKLFHSQKDLENVIDGKQFQIPTQLNHGSSNASFESKNCISEQAKRNPRYRQFKDLDTNAREQELETFRLDLINEGHFIGDIANVSGKVLSGHHVSQEFKMFLEDMQRQSFNHEGDQNVDEWEEAMFFHHSLDLFKQDSEKYQQLVDQFVTSTNLVSKADLVDLDRQLLSYDVGKNQSFKAGMFLKGSLVCNVQSTLASVSKPVQKTVNIVNGASLSQNLTQSKQFQLPKMPPNPKVSEARQRLLDKIAGKRAKEQEQILFLRRNQTEKVPEAPRYQRSDTTLTKLIKHKNQQVQNYIVNPDPNAKNTLKIFRDFDDFSQTLDLQLTQFSKSIQ